MPRISPTLHIAATLLATAVLVAVSSHAAEKPAGDRIAGSNNSSKNKVNSNGRNAGKRTAKNGGKKRPAVALTPEREAAAITFVKQNHPSLALLLVELKKANPREYQRAMRDLFRTSERLANWRESDMLRYDLEVKAWQSQSRVQLLVVRLQMTTGDDQREALRNELASELRRQSEVRVAILKRERAKVAERLSKIDSQIEQFTSRRDEFVQKQLRLLERSTRQRSKSSNGRTSPLKTSPVKTRVQK